MTEPEMRTCTCCGQSKELSEFYQRFGRPSRMSTCRTCFIAQTSKNRVKRKATAIAQPAKQGTDDDK